METTPSHALDVAASGEASFAALFSQAAAGLAEVDLEGRFLRVNDRYCAIVGRTRSDLLSGVRMQDITHPDDLEQNLALFRAAVDANESFEIEKRYVRPDGTLVWVNNSVTCIRDAVGQPKSVLALSLNITGRKRTEDALRASEERYRLAVASFHGATYDTDLETGYAYRAPRLYELLGVRPEDREPTNEWWFSRIHPEDAPRFHAARDALLSGEAPELDIEIRVRHETGGWIWVWQRGLAVRDDTGRVRRTMGAILDITQRRNAEEALRRSETRYRRLTAQSPLSVQTIAPDGTVREVNRAWEDLFGVTVADIEGYNIHADRQLDERGIRPFLDRAFAGEPVEIPPAPYVPDRGRYAGRPLWVRVIAYPVTGNDGNVEEVVLIHEDVTDRQEAEVRQRILIDELNHRVKNTLATVQAIVGQTLRSARTPHEFAAAFQDRLMALARAHDVLTRESWTGASLREIVLQAIEPYRGERESRFEVEGPQVRLSPHVSLALAMILQELTTNAVKYGALSNASGRVRITWELEDARLRLRWVERGGPPVCEPSRRGFGSRLIERGLSSEPQGEVRIAFHPEGVVCTIDAATGPF